jgi:transposase
LSAHYKRLSRRIGKKKTIVAVAHTILVLIYHMIKHSLPFKELGDDHFNKMDKEKIKNTMIKRMETLGYKVLIQTVEEKAVA